MRLFIDDLERAFSAQFGTAFGGGKNLPMLQIFTALDMDSPSFGLSIKNDLVVKFAVLLDELGNF